MSYRIMQKTTIYRKPMGKNLFEEEFSIEVLSKKGCLFDEFRTFLDNKGLSFNEGKIIDATFVEALKPRNTREENGQIKAGKGKELWNPEEGDSKEVEKFKKHKKRHKDIDARWTKKRVKITMATGIMSRQI